MAMIVMIARARPMAIPPWTTAATVTAILPMIAHKTATMFGAAMPYKTAAAIVTTTQKMIAPMSVTTAPTNVTQMPPAPTPMRVMTVNAIVVSRALVMAVVTALVRALRVRALVMAVQTTMNAPWPLMAMVAAQTTPPAKTALGVMIAFATNSIPKTSWANATEMIVWAFPPGMRS